MFAALYDWLLLVHILAAMLWLGGITVVGAFALRILPPVRRDPEILRQRLQLIETPVGLPSTRVS